MPGDEGSSVVIYWDASAILSCLVRDAHTALALGRLSEEGYHLVSSQESFAGGPWRWVEASPERSLCESLAAAHGLRGADLWHLATALTIRRRLPEITLLTYDRILAQAAAAEGLCVTATPWRQGPRGLCSSPGSGAIDGGPFDNLAEVQGRPRSAWIGHRNGSLWLSSGM